MSAVAAEVAPDTERAEHILKLRRQAQDAGAVGESWGKRAVTLMIQLGHALSKYQDAGWSENSYVARLASEGENVEEFVNVNTRTISMVEAAAMKAADATRAFGLCVPLVEKKDWQ